MLQKGTLCCEKRMIELLLWRVESERIMMQRTGMSCEIVMLVFFQYHEHTRCLLSHRQQNNWEGLKYSSKNQSSRDTSMSSVPCHSWQSHHVTPQVYNWLSSIFQLIRFFFFALMPPSRKLLWVFTVIMSKSLLIITISFFTVSSSKFFNPNNTFFPP